MNWTHIKKIVYFDGVRLRTFCQKALYILTYTQVYGGASSDHLGPTGIQKFKTDKGPALLHNPSDLLKQIHTAEKEAINSFSFYEVG